MILKQMIDGQNPRTLKVACGDLSRTSEFRHTLLVWTEGNQADGHEFSPDSTAKQQDGLGKSPPSSGAHVSTEGVRLIAAIFNCF